MEQKTEESHDEEIATPECDYLKKRKNRAYTISVSIYIVTAAVAGLIAVLFAELFNIVIRYTHLWFEHYPALSLFLSPFCLIVAGEMVRRLAPYSGGSGIPQVIKAVKSYHENRAMKPILILLGPKVMLIKIASALVALFGGASVGREGPTVQVSAALFNTVADTMRKYIKFDLHSFVAAGAACGVAAAFNTPLAGIAFAFEEITNSSFSRIKRGVILAIIISGLVAQMIHGSYSHFGSPALQNHSTYSLIGISIFIGVITGVLGALFIKLMLKGDAFIRTLPEVHRRFTTALIGGFFIAVFALITSGQTLGTGSLVVLETFENNTALSFLFAPLKLLATAISFFSGSAGGIFAPSLSIGAGFGNNIGQILMFDDLVACTILGMAGYFAGATHGPLTSFLIVMEMTNKHAILFPLMITSYIAYGVSRGLQNRSIYQALADRIQISLEEYKKA